MDSVTQTGLSTSFIGAQFLVSLAIELADRHSLDRHLLPVGLAVLLDLCIDNALQRRNYLLRRSPVTKHVFR